MEAVRIERTGGPEVMGLVEVDLPEPGSGEIRVRLGAVGVNFIDIYRRSGLYPRNTRRGESNGRNSIAYRERKTYLHPFQDCHGCLSMSLHQRRGQIEWSGRSSLDNLERTR